MNWLKGEIGQVCPLYCPIMALFSNSILWSQTICISIPNDYFQYPISCHQKIPMVILVQRGSKYYYAIRGPKFSYFLPSMYSFKIWSVPQILAGVSRYCATPGDILARFGKKRRSKKTEGENSRAYRLSKANSLLIWNKICM